MTVRIYIVILFFWALLTVVTPTLVRLAASANLHAKLDAEGREGVKLLLPRKALADAIVSVPAPAPSPETAPAAVKDGVSGGEDAILDELRPESM